MNKAVLAGELATRFRMPQDQAATVVQAVFDAMTAALVRGDKIEVRGFGSFHVRRRRARVGYNPKTRTPVDIPAKRVVYFRAAREMRRLLAAGPTAAD